MRPVVLALVTSLALWSCGKDKRAEATAPSASATASAAPKPAASTAPLPKAEKLDVDGLKKALKCGKAAGPCEVLAQFKDCVEWSPVVKSGDGRWLGEGFVVKSGAFIDEYTVVRSKSVPSSETPGALPVKIAIDNIPDDRPGEKLNAGKAVRAFERGDVALPSNTAIRYVKERKDWSDAPAVQADNNQIYVATGSGAHLCMLKNQRLVLIKLAADRGHPADGVYAILFGVSW